MKKHLILCFLLLFCSFCKADQLAYLSKAQADQALELLKEQKELILWCACCPENEKQKVRISNIYIQFTGQEQYYTLVLEAVDSEGNVIKEELDLAYVHIKIGSKAYNVGNTLGFECNPCVSPFFWI